MNSSARIFPTACLVAGTEFGYTSAAKSDFSHAELNGARIGKADFSNTTFFKTLIAAEFDDTNLAGANFEGAYVMSSSFINVDLRKTRGLNRAHFYPPVTIDARSIIKSGQLPRPFYRAYGLTDKMSSAFQRILRSGQKRTKVFIS
jgi:hypothetical protein